MNFDSYFKFTSYAVVACGALALLASGGVSYAVAAIFALALLISWRLEGTKWQFSERFGLVLIVLALPLYYLDWQYQIAVLSRERAGAATLAHLILGLSVIKLFQTKTDRDWVFLYLISFFEVLLAAGLSISPTFFATLVLYLLFAVCTIIAFEIRKTGRGVKILKTETGEKKKKPNLSWRLPIAATAILLAISFIAVPMFFMMPRVGGAGFGGGGSGLSGFVGFSDKVSLGSIGRLQQSNEVVMRVRVENEGAALTRDLRWRGAALDLFDNQNWYNTARNARELKTPDEKGLFRFGTVDKAEDLTVQTIYLEPLDTPVLFGASRIVAIQGSFQIINRDLYDEGITLPRNFERVVYKVYSDTVPPEAKVLRADRAPFSANDKNRFPTKESQRYLQYPVNIDQRIPALAEEIITKANAKNRYDAARAVERYLQTQFGYTLDLKAGGNQPLADFLFNVREGHCEYFATAMAIMLRTQGVSTRIVNGFQTGEYNDAAGAFIVTQKEAHSWVEVYFPETNSWVTFDPTPAAGRNLSAQENAANFFTAQFSKYIEALNMFWLQYVVAFDNNEQRTMARAFRETILENQAQAAGIWQSIWQQIKQWWNNLKGANGAEQSFQTIAQTVLTIAVIVVFVVLLRLLGKRISWRKIAGLFGNKNDTRRIVEFYERMTHALAKKGVRRAPAQTPLEFALAVNAPEAVKITEAYNRVRFGAQDLTRDETNEIENWLKSLESN